ncbi:TIGR03915 family putative DNA repair protein [Clostridium vincentii]|uniref:DUF4130 domain-containing protein n=1 Tax=Clostridium vincentii TaxID=52704 RepID=A0A2T0B8T1_9CLOT|nr:TIGR03915 family putative DNA repair protein [Clostridium vincentii]PRR80291.1 hypothetical protein CLVI_30810 [Clostridium vincentii]
MKIFLYDGSFEGLLTCIYESFYTKAPPEWIYNKIDFNEFLLGEVISIATDTNKFKKVKDGIINKIDPLAFKKIYLVYLSNYKDKEIVILTYLKTAFKLKKDVHNFLNLDIVRLVDAINKRVSLESHRFEGFIRFNYINDRFLYSAIEPDNDILELIAEHFKNRFSNEYLIIHDIFRNKALIYDSKSYEIVPMNIEDYEELKNYNDKYTVLWKEYFKSTTIIERKNSKLQKRMMPKRYWKHLVETK